MSHIFVSSGGKQGHLRTLQKVAPTEAICETVPEFLTFLDKLDSPQCVTKVDSVLGDTKNGQGARPSVCEKPRVR